jgi:PAS domain S-box-containing protein
MDYYRKSAVWVALGALGGWLAAYPLAVLTLWGMAGHAAGPLFAELAADNLPQFLGRLLPVNLISCLLGAGIGILVHRALRARRDLQEREARFRNMAAAAPDAIITMDAGGRVSFWNAAAERIFGYTRDEAVGMDLHRRLVPERYRTAFEQGYAGFRETGKGNAIGRTLELTAVRKDGSEFAIELSLSAFHLQGQWHAMGIVRDISDRKLAEAERMAKEKLQGVLEMAGAASHNLNQPLQSVLWHTQALIEELPEENYLHKELNLIKDQVDKMRDISAKIMKITRYRTVDYYRDIKIIDIDQASEKTRTLSEDDEATG